MNGFIGCTRPSLHIEVLRTVQLRYHIITQTLDLLPKAFTLICADLLLNPTLTQ